MRLVLIPLLLCFLTVIAVQFHSSILRSGYLFSFQEPIEDDNRRVVTDKLVDHVNSQKTTWVASTNQGAIGSLTLRQAKKLMGVLPVRLIFFFSSTESTNWFFQMFHQGGPKLPPKTFDDLTPLALPDTFDARSKWVTRLLINLLELIFFTYPSHNV